MAESDKHLDVTIFAGKGGVGKTSLAVSLALYFAACGEKTAVIDYDGGHRVGQILGFPKGSIPHNTLSLAGDVDVFIVEKKKFRSITSFQSSKGDKEYAEYFGQFPDDEGIMPWLDMGQSYFGLPTAVMDTQKWCSLTIALYTLLAGGYKRVVIDMEPTAGLERLLHFTFEMVRSLYNLRRRRTKLIASAAGWNEILAFLHGEYLRNIDRYAPRITETGLFLREARYLLVCTPEEGPVEQLEQIVELVRDFKAKVAGFVVNGVQGREFEAANIARIEQHGLRLLRIPWHKELHLAGDRVPALRSIGQKVAEKFL